MSIILTATFCGFKIQKLMLFGRHKEHPVWRIDLGIVRINTLSAQAQSVLQEAVSGLIEDPDWLIKNNRRVMLARRKAEVEVQEAHALTNGNRINSLLRQLEASERKRGELSNDVIALRRVIAGLQRDQHDQHSNP